MCIEMTDNCNFMASVFSENTVTPFCDFISALLRFRSVNGTTFGCIQSYSKKSYSQKLNYFNKRHDVREGVNSCRI